MLGKAQQRREQAAPRDRVGVEREQHAHQRPQVQVALAHALAESGEHGRRQRDERHRFFREP